MNFMDAVTIVLEHEGGYVNHPSDPGGETNFGITKGAARAHGYTGDMRYIPMGVVQHIYRLSYWDKVRAMELPPALRLHVFDAAVNSGVSRAIRWLQEAAGVDVDGVIGPKTLHAALSVSPARYSAVRLRFLTGLRNFDTFGRGWTRRIADNLARVS